MTMPVKSRPQRSIRGHLIVGFAIVALLVCGVGGWAATTEIAGAVIAQGVVVVDSNVKKVQHATGGIVGEIRVRDGDAVNAGDIVLRLDDTIARANLAIINKRLIELTARKARLVSERDRRPEIRFPNELTRRLDDPEIHAITLGEQKLFLSLQDARSGQKSQLRKRVVQLHDEIKGLKARALAKSKEFALIQKELEGARRLWSKDLMPISKLTALERQATEIEGERAQLVSRVAQAKGKIAETELQIIQIDREHIASVSKELSETDAKIGEFVERRIAAEDQLKRIDIRSPQAGTVHQSIAHTIGGVIQAGETIMFIVPKADSLTVEARIEPQNIDQLKLGQTAGLRFSAFNQTTTPEIDGTLTRISADITNDERLGTSYYTVRISLQPDQVARLGSVQLIPGMPVETFIRTENRKVFSYLLKPMTDQVLRAFRER